MSALIAYFLIPVVMFYYGTEIIYFLSSHNPQRKFNMIYAASTEEEDEDMPSRSTSAPKNKNNNVLSGNIVNTRSLSLPSKIQNLSLSDSLTFGRKLTKPSQTGLLLPDIGSGPPLCQVLRGVWLLSFP